MSPDLLDENLIVNCYLSQETTEASSSNEKQ